MKKVVLLLCIVFLFFPLEGRFSRGRYISRMTQDGTIFFLYPQKLGVLSGIKRFEYDMTLLSWADSVTVNFTFESSSMTVPDELNIIGGETVLACDNFSMLFVDIKKNAYELRITSKFLISDISDVLMTEISPSFVFMQDGLLKTAAYKEKEWGKDRLKLQRILQLYDYSKN